MKKLSQLEIPSFEEILGLQQQTAKKILIEHGVLPRIKEKKPAFLCWGCGQVMEKTVVVSDVGAEEIVVSVDASKILTLCGRPLLGTSAQTSPLITRPSCDLLTH